MANYGIPFEDTTDGLRSFRTTVGDTAYTEITPPPANPEWTANYVLFSDLEAQTYIDQSDENSFRAAGWAFMTLSAQAALRAKSVKDYDLSVDLTKRAEDLRAAAQFFFDQADALDLEDGFFIGSTGVRCDLIWPPELAPWDLSQFLCSRCVRPFCICEA